MIYHLKRKKPKNNSQKKKKQTKKRKKLYFHSSSINIKKQKMEKNLEKKLFYKIIKALSPDKLNFIRNCFHFMM